MTVDPSHAHIRGLPKNVEDLAVTAHHSWILAFDNISDISETMSDALCRLSTGGGHSTRAFYTNDEEVILNSKRPVILNGIASFICRPDLLQRTLLVKLPPIPPAKRLTDTEIDKRFKRLHPELLGAVLNAVVVVLKNLPQVTLDQSPRMADFAMWAAAAESVIGIQPKKIVPLLLEKQSEALLTELDSPLAQAILDILDVHNGKISILMGGLLKMINEIAPDAVRGEKIWPKKERGLRSQLERIKPVLREVGVEITFLKRTNRGTPVLIQSDGRMHACDGRPEKAEVATVH
jgi:hypothetical protein